jgi:hypothetical protein
LAVQGKVPCFEVQAAAVAATKMASAARQLCKATVTKLTATCCTVQQTLQFEQQCCFNRLPSADIFLLSSAINHTGV